MRVLHRAALPGGHLQVGGPDVLANVAKAGHCPRRSVRLAMNSCTADSGIRTDRGPTRTIGKSPRAIIR